MHMINVIYMSFKTPPNMKNNETQMSQNNDFDGLVVSENCNARLIPTIISAVDGVKSLRRWRSWWKARLRQIRSPLTSSRHLPLNFWVYKPRM